MSDIALIGASGQVGSRILNELVQRGHAVTAIARHRDNIAALPKVTPVACDIADQAQLIKVLTGHSVVISAVKFTDTTPPSLISAVKRAGAERYLVVGGAGSLEVAPGQLLVDQPDFPEAYRAEASAGLAFLNALRQETDLDWTFLSPSALFTPGERTGIFRLGTDSLLVNDQGSHISYEDYAVALVNEIEQPAHRRQRFTVGY